MSDRLVHLAREIGAEEISLTAITPISLHPGIDPRELCVCSFPGEEKNSPKQCFIPDGVGEIVTIANGLWRDRRDVKAFHIQRCLRRQRPQLGHTREFTQFGFNILNPQRPRADAVKELAEKMISQFTDQCSLHAIAPKYPYDFESFEIRSEVVTTEKLQGSRGRICVGGRHRAGYGFSIDIERLLLILHE